MRIPLALLLVALLYRLYLAFSDDGQRNSAWDLDAKLTAQQPITQWRTL